MQLVLELTWIVLKIGPSNVKYVTINFEPYYCKGGMTKYVLKNRKKKYNSLWTIDNCTSRLIKRSNFPFQIPTTQKVMQGSGKCFRR